MADGVTYRDRMARARDRAREADKRIMNAKADLAVATQWFSRWRAKLDLAFAERERDAALRAHRKAKHRLMAMVI